MGKLQESLERSSEHITADILPSWTSVIITIVPLAIRAILRRHDRKQLTKEVSEQFDNYLNNYRKPIQEIKKERKAFVSEHKLPVMRQKDFNKLPLKEGKRFCPAGFDYSEVEPGETPCLFDDVDKKTEKGLKRIAQLFGNKSTLSYLGGGKQWPGNSYFGSNVVIGRGSGVGARSVINESTVNKAVSLGSGCIGKGCHFDESCDIGASFVGLGGVIVGDGCRIGAGADFRPETGTNTGGYIIGNDVTIDTGFKIKGADNTIKNNATIGPMSNMSGVSILKNGLSIDVGGVLTGCSLTAGSAEYSSDYTINRCFITGGEASTILASNGSFNDCEFEGDVITVSGSNYDGCTFTNINHVAGHSKLVGCLVSSDTATVVDSNSVIIGGAYDGVVMNGKLEQPISARDVDFRNCELTNTFIEGDGSELKNVLLGRGCEMKGAIRLDETIQVKSDLKIRQTVLSDDFKPPVLGSHTVSFYTTAVNTESLILHKSINDPAKFRFVSGNTNGLKTVIANHELVTFGKGLFNGNIVKPSLDNHPQVQPIELERPVVSKTTNAPQSNDAGNHDGPPIEVYEDSVSNQSYQGYEDMMQQYDEQNSHHADTERSAEASTKPNIKWQDKEPDVKPIEPKQNTGKTQSTKPNIKWQDKEPDVKPIEPVSESKQNTEKAQSTKPKIKWQDKEPDVKPIEPVKSNLSHKEVLDASPLNKSEKKIDHDKKRQAIKGSDVSQNKVFDAQSIIAESDKNAKAKGVEQSIEVSYDFFNR